MLLADVGMASGHAGLADALFLVAFIIAVIAVVIRLMARSIDGVLIAAVLACLALGWFVL